METTQQTGNVMKKTVRHLTFGAALLWAQSSGAAIVHLAGDTVDFYYDDAQPGMAAYGSLTAVGDAIFATPDQFQAEVGGNGGVVTFSALGTVTVVVKPGYAFDAISVAQEGDYLVSGIHSSVNVTGNLSVADSNNPATSEALVMSNSGLGMNDGQTHTWTSSGSFDLSTAMWNGVNSVELSLDTLLQASTPDSSGDYAFIQNKFTGVGMVTIQTTVVPVPAAVWLMASGLLGLVAAARRRTAV